MKKMKKQKHKFSTTTFFGLLKQSKYFQKTNKIFSIFYISSPMMPLQLLGSTADHLLVLIQWFLSLQHHLLVKLLYERFNSPVQLILTQRRIFPELHGVQRRSERGWWVVRTVLERLWFVHSLRWRVLSYYDVTPMILPRIRFLQVSRQRHVTAVRYHLPCVLQCLVSFWLRYS